MQVMTFAPGSCLSYVCIKKIIYESPSFNERTGLSDRGRRVQLVAQITK